MHDRRGLADDLVEEDDGTLTSTHAKHETVVDVLKAVRPVIAHQLQDLEELGKVQVLLGSDNVDHLVELVLVVSLDRSADITGEVD